MKQEIIGKQWRRAARGRLKVELAGIAFARKSGQTPEDWAQHLWSTGAVNWIGKTDPTAAEYFAREVEAFRTLYPEVAFEVTKQAEDAAELVFARGNCLGGWGKNQWAVANGLGLGKGHVCRYCRQAFRTWAGQLGLQSCPAPQTDGSCIFRVRMAPKK